MRRFLSTLLAILVLALSCTPCNDADAMPTPAGEVTLKAATHNTGNRPQTDACSPFCICSCCAGFALPVDTYGIPTPIPAYTAKPCTGHIPEAILRIALPIWQPPQLV